MRCMKYTCCVPGCDAKKPKLRGSRDRNTNATGVTLCLFPKEKETTNLAEKNTSEFNDLIDALTPSNVLEGETSVESGTEPIFDIWLDRIGVPNFKEHSMAEVRENLRVCMKHFSSHSRMDPKHCANKRIPYKYGSLPTLFMPNFHEEPTEENSVYKFSIRDVIDIVPKNPSTPSTNKTEMPVNGELKVTRIIDDPVLPLPTQLLPEEETIQVDSDIELLPNPSPEESRSRRIWKRPVTTVSRSPAAPELTPVLPEKVRSLKISKRPGTTVSRSPATPELTPVRPEKIRCLNIRRRPEITVSRSPPPPELPPVVDKTSEEYLKLSQMFERVLFERPPSLQKRKAPSETDGEPTKKRLAFKSDGENESFDKFIIESFNSAETLANTAFAALGRQPPPSLVDHSYGSASTIDLLKSSAKLCDFNERKLKSLRQALKIREDEITQLEQATLKFINDMLDNHAVDLIKECYLHVVPVLCKRGNKEGGNEPSEFPNDVKQFFIILLMYSNKAYGTLMALLNLPCQHDVRYWATSYRGYPGFTGASVDRIKAIVGKMEKGPVLACLFWKEIRIKKRIDWDGERLLGYCDLGFGNVNHDYIPEASSALVFYLAGMEKTWKLPVGYCFIGDASPTLRANLVIQYLLKFAHVGVRVMAIIADGSVHSYNTFKALGVSLEDVNNDVAATFLHPAFKQEKVRCFVDIDDVVLALSQYIEQKGALVSREETLIDWSLISKIHKFRDSDFMQTRAFNRITKETKHELYTIYLKLKKDDHPIGRHTPAALAYFKNAGLPEFSDALETCMFLENVFQLENLFKTYLIIGKDEVAYTFTSGLNVFLNNVKTLVTYFMWLKDLKEGFVFNTRRKLPIILILMNLMNLKGLTKMCTSRYLHFTIFTSKFTLKYLKDFITEIHSRVGPLPSALEFKNAYQDLVENPNLQKPLPQKNGTLFNQDLEIAFASAGATYEYAPIITECDNVDSFLADKMIHNWITKESNCSDCIDILMGSPVRGYLTEPVAGVTDRRQSIARCVVGMIKIVEKSVKFSRMPTAANLNCWLDRLTCQCLEEIATTRDWFKQFDHLFDTVEYGRTTHYVVMLKGLIRVFLRIRLEFLRQDEAVKIRFPLSYSTKTPTR